MSGKPVQFVNPDNLPVERVTLTVRNDGVVKQVKALDPYWAENRRYILYQMPPSDSQQILGAVDTWKISAKIFIENVKGLLSLEHHRFWSTIIYNKKCMDSLVSFLQEANPPYMSPHENRDVEKLFGDIRRYVFVIFCRLITNKESESQWMTKEYMAATLYNNFIFTLPIIWDICLIYGLDNRNSVSRLVSTVFSLQPAYEKDALEAVAFVNEAVKFIILQVNNDYDCEEAPNLPDTFSFLETNASKGQIPNKFTINMVKDLAIHLLDTAMTLRIFIEVYPKIIGVLRKTNTVNSIVQIYEYGVPQLYEKLIEVGDPKSILYKELERFIDMARAEMVDIFREILAIYKNAILSGEGSIKTQVENYLAVMMDGLSEKLLIRDYHACYPVNEDIDMLTQAYPEIDTVKTDFILAAIYANLNEPIPERVRSEMTNGRPKKIESLKINEPGSSKEYKEEMSDKVRIESLITEVKDILPHLGDGFILKCLEYYEFDVEKVINSILEGHLADCLKGIDHTLPIIPEDPLDKAFLETGVARLNVFDGDEFDMLTRDDVDFSRIHRGKKKSKYKNINDMLNDKSEVKKDDIYNKYNLVYDEEAMYSDEYDDSYDVPSVVPAGDTSEVEDRRPFVTPRALQPNKRPEVQYESESSSEEEDDNASGNKNRMDFCVNPEEVRARREASWQARARRGKGLKPPTAAKTKDVIGKPKGQGQEKEVLVNRDRKEKSKSSRGNHSRRQGAMFKRSQGMMPS